MDIECIEDANVSSTSMQGFESWNIFMAEHSGKRFELDTLLGLNPKNDYQSYKPSYDYYYYGKYNFPR